MGVAVDGRGGYVLRMFRRILALTLVGVFFAAFTLQGFAIMKCSRSGKVFIAGWHQAGCAAAAENAAGEDCCCETEREEVEPSCGIDCCLLVGMLPENLMVAQPGFEIPVLPVSGLVTFEFPKADAEMVWSLWETEIRDPDPPGSSLRVLYASFLI